jgi:succinate dehydrogenase / fumarate reductase cytochrome b subunit
MNIKRYVSSSVGKKQIVAVSGLALVLFLIAHLSGNLLIFKGPEAFNTYAEMLHSLGGLLWVARIGLITLFGAHIWFTVLLILENKAARGGQGYQITKNVGNRSFATKTMRYTGPLVAFFLALHLIDFTLPISCGRSPVAMGLDLGLYGIVMNSFQNPLRVALYIAAMLSIGFHLSHGIQSTAQTMGMISSRKSKLIKKISVGLGTIIAIGFSAIPLYLYTFQYMATPQREFYKKYSHLAVTCESMPKECCTMTQPKNEEFKEVPAIYELPPEQSTSVSANPVEAAQPVVKKYQKRKVIPQTTPASAEPTEQPAKDGQQGVQ